MTSDDKHLKVVCEWRKLWCKRNQSNKSSESK